MDMNVASPLLEASVLSGASLLDVLQLGGVEGRVKRLNGHAGEQELGEGQVHSSALTFAHAAVARQQAADGRTGSEVNARALAGVAFAPSARVPGHVVPHVEGDVAQLGVRFWKPLLQRPLMLPHVHGRVRSGGPRVEEGQHQQHGGKDGEQQRPPQGAHASNDQTLTDTLRLNASYLGDITELYTQ